MANRSINELDGMWEKMRDIVKEYDVKIIAPAIPRERPIVPRHPDGFYLMDYPSLLDPCKIAKDIVITRSKDIHSRQVTLQVMKHRKHNPDNLQVYRYDCGNKPPK